MFVHYMTRRDITMIKGTTFYGKPLTTVQAIGISLISMPLVTKATDAHKTAPVRILPPFSNTKMFTSICNFGNVS